MKPVFPAEKLVETKIWYPHVYTKLELLWGEPECEKYLNSLVISNREGNRAGFPEVVMIELLNVHELLTAPVVAEKPSSVWGIFSKII
jgi:hypothetical protein